MKNVDILKDCIDKKISQIAEDLIEKNPQDYYTGTSDYGYYNNGVGMACYGYENTYDEDLALENAREELVKDILNKDNKEYLFDLLEDESFRTALANLIRGIQ